MRQYETIGDALLLARDVLDRSLDANQGCALIATIAGKLGHPPSLEDFTVLAHEQTGHQCFGIAAEDCVDEIFSACHSLLEAGIAKTDA
ncbi:hypothetical protein O0880_12110 [Janthinobacterium sp. SUN118]|uniref:hypothetical protein n=1 Tax=Janthinobacterium sp. SUN118 TaxID=3004100 RepID=UPI0025B0F15E|nr:hypothetical protein [Janthinobacterium sp. SUN118]MDN2710163.1 hypothetical protein [Janthinobacterium sp. SUN118]